jgi:hypothetical protein
MEVAQELPLWLALHAPARGIKLFIEHTEKKKNMADAGIKMYVKWCS